MARTLVMFFSPLLFRVWKVGRLESRVERTISMSPGGGGPPARTLQDQVRSAALGRPQSWRKKRKKKTLCCLEEKRERTRARIVREVFVHPYDEN